MLEGNKLKENIEETRKKEQQKEIKTRLGLNNGDSVFFSCDKEHGAAKIAGFVRNELGEKLRLLHISDYNRLGIVG